MEKTSSQEDQFICFLRSGSKVEIRSEEDGYDNAWFLCEIVHPPSPPSYTPTGPKGKKRTALIKHDHKLNAGGDKPLVERVDTRFIRPNPPFDSLGQPFELYDVVDAFFNEIWWTGFVVKVVGDRYTVAFKKPLDLREFRRSDLRTHWDRVESNWVRPEKEDTTGLIYIPGTEVEVNRRGEGPCHAWLPAVVIGKVESTDSFLVKYKNSDNDGEEVLKEETIDHELIRPCPPKIEDRDFNVLEKVDAFHGSCWWVGLITEVLEGKRYSVSFRHKKEIVFNHSGLRPHWEWIGEQWVNKSKQQEAGEIENETVISPKKKGRPRNSHESSGSTLVDIENEQPCLSNRRDNQKELSHHVENSPNFECSNMEKENHISSGDGPVEVITSGDNEKTKQHEAREIENQAIISPKKRGRSQKSQAFTSWPRKRRRDVLSRSNSKGTLQKIADIENMEVNQVMTEATEACNLIEKFEGVNGAHVENCCQLPIENEQNGDATISGEMKGNGENPELLVVNSLGAAGGEELAGAGGADVADSTTEKSESLAVRKVILTLADTTEEVDATLVSPMPVEIYDQALVMHVDETHSPTNIGESAIIGTASTDNIVRADVQNLPFVKNYPVWQMIRSMEVYQKLPQNPKFQPLLKYKELKREGLAVACMLNFANLVDKFSKLQETDSIQDMEGMMEELVELEEMGFNVMKVRGRLSKLMEFKVMLEKLNHKLNGVEVNIKECSDGKSKIDGEVAEMDQEIKRLKEKHADLMAKRMETTSTELALISESHAINKDISRMMEDFGRLVTTSWRVAYGSLRG